MSQYINSADLKKLIKSCLKRATPMQWIDWLPLAEVAYDAPDKLIEAVNTLDTDDQFGFIDRLREIESGTLADAVLLILSRNVLEIQDEQVREFVLEDAQEAHKRNSLRFKALEENVTPLAKQVERAHERIAEGFNLANEINRLESEVAAIRAAESKQDEKFNRVHALEREILRAETRQRILSHYDEVLRRAHLEELQIESKTLQKSKDGLEKNIGTARGVRDKRKRDFVKLESHLQTLEAEITTINTGTKTTQKGIKSLLSLKEGAAKEKQKLSMEHQMLIAEVEQVEKENADATSRIEMRKKKLKELQKEAQDAGYTDMEKRIREVYALLPDDVLDRACSARGGS